MSLHSQLNGIEHVQNIWLYHINPKSAAGWEYKWDVSRPHTLMGNHDKVWSAGKMSRKINVGDLICVYMKNIRPMADGIYIVGRVTKVMPDDHEFAWKADQVQSSRMLDAPLPKDVVRRFFGRSYGPSMQPLPVTKREEFLSLLGNGNFADDISPRDTQNRPKGEKLPRHPDPLVRCRVEKMAVQITTDHFLTQGYLVDSVEADNVGWDLSAVRGKRELRLEVKGLSGNEICVELTPNEFAQMQKWRDSYQICVVTNVLTDPQLAVFSYRSKSDKWQDDRMRTLRFTQIVAARATVA